MSNMNQTPPMRKAGRIYREMQSEINALRRQANRDDLTMEEQDAAMFMLAVANRLERTAREMGFLVLDLVAEDSDGTQ